MNILAAPSLAKLVHTYDRDGFCLVPDLIASEDCFTHPVRILRDNPDEGLFDSYENRLAVLEIIRKNQADLVFTHFTSEYNLDHNITSDIIFQSALLTNIVSIRTVSPALTSDPKIFYINPGDGYAFEATHFVEISEPLVKETRRAWSSPIWIEP